MILKFCDADIFLAIVQFRKSCNDALLKAQLGVMHCIISILPSATTRLSCIDVAAKLAQYWRLTLVKLSKSHSVKFFSIVQFHSKQLHPTFNIVVHSATLSTMILLTDRDVFANNFKALMMLLQCQIKVIKIRKFSQSIWQSLWQCHEESKACT